MSYIIEPNHFKSGFLSHNASIANLNTNNNHYQSCNSVKDDQQSVHKYYKDREREYMKMIDMN